MLAREAGGRSPEGRGLVDTFLKELRKDPKVETVVCTLQERFGLNDFEYPCVKVGDAVREYAQAPAARLIRGR
eukprot:4430601-Heterocapsa_arctica.AAC.1